MLISKRIKLYFSLVSLAAVILTSITVGYLVYTLTVNIITEEKQKELEAFRDLKTIEIENYFKEIRSEVLVFSNNDTIVDALTKFTSAFHSYPKTKNQEKFYRDKYNEYLYKFKEGYLKRNGENDYGRDRMESLVTKRTLPIQYKYVINNPFKFTEKSNLYDVEDDSEYNKVHKAYHDELKKIKDKFEFYDIFLIDNEGNIVYTVSKEMDFGSSVSNQYLFTSSLGEVYEAIRKSDDKNEVVISDFKPYLPSFNMEAGFLATSVFNKQGKKIGVLAFQLSLDAINKIMTNNYKWEEVGLGKSGETYLLGPDYEFRSISRFAIQDLTGYLYALERAGMSKASLTKIRNRKNNIGIHAKKTLGAELAFKKREGFHIYKDYRNIEVLSSFKPLNIEGLNWVIIADIDKKEAYKPAHKVTYQIIMFSLAIALVVALFAWYMSSLLADVIMKPIKRYCKVIAEIAKTRNLTRRIEVKTKDELGEMAIQLNSLLESFQNSCKTTKESTLLMYKTAAKLKEIAAKSEHISAPSEEEEISKDVKEASTDINELCKKLEKISEDFEFLEEEAEKRSYW